MHVSAETAEWATGKVELDGPLERGPRPTAEDLLRYAQAGKPKRLSPSELDIFTGQVAWPILLRSGEFALDREKVEKMLADRAALGTVATEDFLQANAAADRMLAGLKQHVREAPTSAYLSARRFLESLAYEVAQPTTRLAANANPAAAALASTP